MSDNVEHVREAIPRRCRRKRERDVANLIHSAMLHTRFIEAVAKNNPSVAAAAAVWKQLQEHISIDMLAEFEEAIIKIEQE